jgi:hypothetical protein
MTTSRTHTDSSLLGNNILSIDLFNSLPENYKSRIYPVIVLYECSRHGPLARDRENEWLKASLLQKKFNLMTTSRTHTDSSLLGNKTT